MKRGHIDEVCWLFDTSQPTQDQLRAYDILLELNGWDELDIAELGGKDKAELREEAKEYLESAKEIADELFEMYSEELARSLKVDVNDLESVVSTLANDDFGALSVNQCTAETIAWHKIRERWAQSYPKNKERFWDIVNEMFQEKRYKSGY